MNIEVIFNGGKRVDMGNVDRFAFDSMSKTFVLEDDTGIAYIPASAVMIVMEKKDTKK